MVYYPKDFILTPEGLAFAVVAAELEDDRALGFLRYQKTPTGWKKLHTAQANALLTQEYPGYLFYSQQRDITCHAVPINNIHHHYQPRQRLQNLLKTPDPDPVLQTCVALVQLLQVEGIDISAMGVTGSLLIGTQHPDSDIDLVFYDRATFQQCRQLIPTLITQNRLQPLSGKAWQDAYQRRGCDLNFEDYVWHEQRKANKALFKGLKVDFSLVCCDPAQPQPAFQKQGFVTRTLQVTDDDLAYDHPAEYKVMSNGIERVLCFTATYTGQAVTGEWIEVAGQLEVAATGLARIVVGSSREAEGEYIKVIHR